MDQNGRAGAPQSAGPCFTGSILVFWPLLVTACLEYNPFERELLHPVPDSGAGPNSDSATWPRLVEICDGLDNDGDGAVDEGFEDLDENGAKDCLECEAATVAEGEVPVRSNCGPAVQVENPWNVVVEWEVAGLGSLWAPPLVGDLDRDGTPDLVLIEMFGGNKLYSLDGRSGTVEWSRPWESHEFTASTLANVDSDAKFEIISHLGNFDSYPVLMDHDGTIQWTASVSPDTWRLCVPIVADLDGDGDLELISSDIVYDLTTGIAIATLPSNHDEKPLPAVGDIDLDGTQEIVRQGCVFEHNFVERWCVEDWHQTYISTSALLQFDSDPEAEVLFLNDEMSIYDTDGTPLVKTSVAPGLDYTVSPPTIADFDGDGRAEVAFATRGRLQLRELDGSLRWARTLIDDSNGIIGIVGRG